VARVREAPEEISRKEIFFWNANTHELSIPNFPGRTIGLHFLPIEGVIRVQAEDTESVESGFRLFLEDGIPTFALN
jgi:hypothetical protein